MYDLYMVVDPARRLLNTEELILQLQADVSAIMSCTFYISFGFQDCHTGMSWAI